jgi:hypothetical protein
VPAEVVQDDEIVADLEEHVGAEIVPNGAV